jgi:hypothetical protein
MWVVAGLKNHRLKLKGLGGVYSIPCGKQAWDLEGEWAIPLCLLLY